MTDRSRAWLAIALLAAAVTGLLFQVRAFDRAERSTDVPAAPAHWMHPPSGPARLWLGAFDLETRGVLHVVVCPTGAHDPHAELEVSSPHARTPEHSTLTADESRGKRCFDAEHEAHDAGRVSAWLVLRSPAPIGTFRTVETQASRQITPRSMWPVVCLVLALALLAFRTRRQPGADAPVFDPVPIPQPAEPLPLPVTETPPAYPPFQIVTPGDAPNASRVEEVPGIAPVDPAVSLGLPSVAEGRPVWQPIAMRRTGALAAVGAFIVIHVVVVVFSNIAALLVGVDRALDSGLFWSVTLLVQHGMFVLAAAWLLGAFRAKRPLLALGFLPLRAVDIARAVLAAGFVIVVAVTTTHFIKDVSASPMGRMVEIVPVRYAIGFGALLAPFSEELFFRGVLVPAFGRTHIAVGVIVSAVFFTAAHAFQLSGAGLGLVPIACVALVNGWLRARSGGISQPWIVHTLYNGVLSLGLYFGS